MSSCLVRRHRDDLAIADDLVLPLQVSLLIPSCHRHYPPRRERRTPFSTYSSLGETRICPGGPRGLGESGRRGRRSCGVTPHPPWSRLGEQPLYSVVALLAYVGFLSTFPVAVNRDQESVIS
jgi:hypothetical protein